MRKLGKQKQREVSNGEKVSNGKLATRVRHIVLVCNTIVL